MTGDCPFCHSTIDYGPADLSVFGGLSEEDIECFPKIQRACNDCKNDAIDKLLDLLGHHDDLEHHLTHHPNDIPALYKNLVEGLKKILEGP